MSASVQNQRQEVLDAAFAAHPERFVRWVYPWTVIEMALQKASEGFSESEIHASTEFIVPHGAFFRL